MKNLPLSNVPVYSTVGKVLEAEHKNSLDFVVFFGTLRQSHELLIHMQNHVCFMCKHALRQPDSQNSGRGDWNLLVVVPRIAEVNDSDKSVSKGLNKKAEIIHTICTLNNSKGAINFGSARDYPGSTLHRAPLGQCPKKTIMDGLCNEIVLLNNI